jgi:transcriptional regulator
MKDHTALSSVISRGLTPHWKDVASGNEALMIFQGPEGYITPNWYPSKAEHGKVVPTWNYAIVHAYGRPEVMGKKDWLRRHVSELTTQQEQTQARPWVLLDAPQSYVDAMLRGIVGFRFVITRIEGKWKMSQNRELNDQLGVTKGLGRRAEGDDLEIADLIQPKLGDDRWRNARSWPRADMPKNAINVAIGGKADTGWCTANVCF